MTLNGGCHCGALRYVLDWPTGQSMPARRCTCSYCTGFSGTWTSHPQATLHLSHSQDATPSRYRFETGTADFLFCSHCGVTVAALDDNSDRLVAVVNIRTLDDVAAIEFDRSDSDFSAEVADDRLDRRARNWIGEVHIFTQ